MLDEINLTLPICKLGTDEKGRALCAVCSPVGIGKPADWQLGDGPLLCYGCAHVHAQIRVWYALKRAKPAMLHSETLAASAAVEDGGVMVETIVRDMAIRGTVQEFRAEGRLFWMLT